MNPQQQESTPSLNLPTPQTELAPVATEVGQEATSSEATARPAAVEQDLSAQTAPVQAVASAATDDPAVNPAAITPVAPIQPTNPAIADDTDLIEKEWVTKAKHIVEQTAKDPYSQNKEMAKVKADYLKKRYNKNLKLAQE